MAKEGDENEPEHATMEEEICNKMPDELLNQDIATVTEFNDMHIHQPHLGSDSQDMTNVLMQTAVGHISTQTRIAYRSRATQAERETSNKSKYLCRQIIFF